MAPQEGDMSLPETTALALPVPRIFVVCDQSDTAPVWGYMLREKGMIVTMEVSSANALKHWKAETSDMVVIDVDIPDKDRIALSQKFRERTVCPILMLLPAHHERQVLEAYSAGVDDVMIKPISPAVFLAKIMAWLRRGWSLPVDGLILVNAGKHILDPARRCVLDPEGTEISLTSLEFRLLHLLMTRPGHIFRAEQIVRFIWGGFGQGDLALLKNVVYRLRRKIELDPGHPRLLQTWPGGYSFQG
jgi:DNA-binding response OmpR family regulator